MSQLKKLAGQTAIYGLSSIVARFLNFLLVPLYTYQFAPEEYGVVTDLYAYVAFFIVLLTFGMETAYFRFSSKSDTPKTYNTAIFWVSFLSLTFLLLTQVLASPIASVIHYPNNVEYIQWFGWILALDALSAIPLARLRQENKAKKFAFINLFSIAINVGLNLFFLVYCKPIVDEGESNFITDACYFPAIGIGYIFISNLVASGLKYLLLLPVYLKARLSIDKKTLGEMLIYASPLMLAGFAGIINETLDRILLKFLLWSKGESYALAQVGIYGACYKITIFLNLFLQAYRYAAEPFFFAKSKDDDRKEVFAETMKIFVLISILASIGIVLYLDIALYFIGEDFRSGAGVVPILLLANVCLGIYYNQSVWYKLTDNTRWGAYLAFIGAFITIVLNILLIPHIGYMGSAWATLACYFSMMVISYIKGHQVYPIPYDLKRIGLYVSLAIAIMLFSVNMVWESNWLKYLVHTALFVSFVLLIFKWEKNNFKKAIAR